MQWSQEGGAHGKARLDLETLSLKAHVQSLSCFLIDLHERRHCGEDAQVAGQHVAKELADQTESGDLGQSKRLHDECARHRAGVDAQSSTAEHQRMSASVEHSLKVLNLPAEEYPGGWHDLGRLDGGRIGGNLPDRLSWLPSSTIELFAE
jgi:hypothetical protein